MDFRDVFVFHKDVLQKMAETHRGAYKIAEPFKHAVIDDFLPAHIADELEASFPAPSEIAWKNKTHEHSKKLASSKEESMPPAMQFFHVDNGRGIRRSEAIPLNVICVCNR